jgi:hypothetical protein
LLWPTSLENDPNSDVKSEKDVHRRTCPAGAGLNWGVKSPRIGAPAAGAVSKVTRARPVAASWVTFAVASTAPATRNSNDLAVVATG